jgi:hypothetical protein
MAVASAAERRFIMDQLGTRAKEDMYQLWNAAERLPDVDFFRYVADAFPDIVIPYNQLAAEFSASIFEEDFPELAATAVVADPPPLEALRKSAEWALGADGRKALDRMAGTIQRHIYDGDRDTTVANAEVMGMRWVRIARPNACAFCRLLASRAAAGVDNYRNSDAVFTNEDGELELRVVGRSTNLSLADRRMIQSGQMTRDEALARRDQMALTYQIGDRAGTPRGRRPRGSRRFGEKYHDDCKCTAKAIPAGRNSLDYLYEVEPEAAESAEQYLTEYNKARETADSGDTKKILSEWRQLGDDIT